MYSPAMPRSFKPVTITIPPEELKDAQDLLPYGEARTFSALVRLALGKLPRPKK